MNRRFLALRFIAMAAVISLSACSPQNNYLPPPNLTVQDAATLVGSKQQVPGLFSDDIEGYHVAVDSKLTLVGPRGWDTSIMIAPGQHVIGIGVARGPSAFGFRDVSVNFESGRSYTVRFKMIDASHANAWIEDDARKAVSDTVLVTLEQAYPSMPIFIPTGR